MRRSHRFRSPRAWGVLCGLAALSAATVNASAQESHSAHEHGSGRLNLALEAGTLMIELIAPGADIVGFEHPPQNKQQTTQLREAVARLRDGATLFGLPPSAGCRQQDARVDSPLMATQAPAAADSHAEFHAQYRFACSNPEALTRLSLQYFTLFPAAHELAVQMITPRGQSATELTPANPGLEL